jgi:hypothetical protein
MMRKSTDQGQTFSNPVTVARLNTKTNLGDLGLTYSNTNSSSFHTSVIPQAAVNPVTGDIYVVYADEPKNSIKDKADIFFAESTDGGATWSVPLRVNDDNTTNDQWNPAIAVTPDGSHVGIFWYDRRLDPANSLIDRFGEIATISGDTVGFLPNFRITDISFLPAFDQDSLLVAFGNTRYMGDYDMATADNNYFYTTWGDNRSGDAFFANQPDVRFAKIPVTGIGGADPPATLSGPSLPPKRPPTGATAPGKADLAGAAILLSAAGSTPPALGIAGWATASDGATPTAAVDGAIGPAGVTSAGLSGSSARDDGTQGQLLFARRGHRSYGGSGPTGLDAGQGLSLTEIDQLFATMPGSDGEVIRTDRTGDG